MRTEIVYEDDFLLVVYKPAGLATQTASVGRQDVVSELKNYIRQTENSARKNIRSAPYLGVIHRLDQPVEGLLVFAKNPKEASRLSGQLQEEDGGFCKHYYAVLYGCPGERSGELEDYLCKKDGRAEIADCRPERREVPGSDAIGKGSGAEEGKKTRKARLHYHIMQTVDISKMISSDIWLKPNGGNRIGTWMMQDGVALADRVPETGGFHQDHTRKRHGEIALADIRLETGRFHQIRAQMAHGGMPLLGDLKYGSEESIETGRKLNVRNVALCAYRLEFVHPVTGRKMDFRINPKGDVFSLFSLVYNLLE